MKFDELYKKANIEINPPTDLMTTLKKMMSEQANKTSYHAVSQTDKTAYSPRFAVAKRMIPAVATLFIVISSIFLLPTLLNDKDANIIPESNNLQTTFVFDEKEIDGFAAQASMNETVIGNAGEEESVFIAEDVSKRKSDRKAVEAAPPENGDAEMPLLETAAYKSKEMGEDESNQWDGYQNFSSYSQFPDGVLWNTLTLPEEYYPAEIINGADNSTSAERYPNTGEGDVLIIESVDETEDAAANELQEQPENVVQFEIADAGQLYDGDLSFADAITPIGEYETLGQLLSSYIIGEYRIISAEYSYNGLYTSVHTPAFDTSVLLAMLNANKNSVPNNDLSLDSSEYFISFTINSDSGSNISVSTGNNDLAEITVEGFSGSLCFNLQKGDSEKLLAYLRAV